MATKNFVVNRGLTVGDNEIIDSAGNVTVPGNLSLSGELTVNNVTIIDNQGLLVSGGAITGDGGNATDGIFILASLNGGNAQGNH